MADTADDKNDRLVMFNSTRQLLDEHMRECDRRAIAVDRKLDKIEDKVATACSKFDDAARRITDGVKDRHEENQAKIDGIEEKLDALPWKLLSWLGGMMTVLIATLITIFRAKLGL